MRGFPECENEKFPQTGVTFFDAVLFANAKSKKNNLDTVYSYTNALFDSENHCIDLEGFSIDYEVKGFRLPTEAEWVNAAQIKWNVKNSWNSDNSKNQIHEVCELQKDTLDFCDFEGNVMEWVNDWKVDFKEQKISNYAGGVEPNDLGERILKGGAYFHNPEAIDILNNSDVYIITSQTYADYVGFRLALGIIPKPVFLNATGEIALNKISILQDASSIEKIIATNKAKLVFRNDLTGNLCFLDYNSSPLRIIEFEDSLNVYHPEISPDGSKVAFCTSPEGVAKKSKVYVRSLKDSALIELDVESAAIPRWDILANGDTVITYVTEAGDNKDSLYFKKQSTWRVSFMNGKFGNPQKILDGAFHGGVDETQNFAVTGSRLLRISKNNEDSIWYNGEQACNVSLSKNGSLQTAFLDFSGKMGTDFVGKKYQVHRRILIADSNGKLIQTIESPEQYTYDHSEWIRGSRFLIASLVNSDNMHSQIALINSQDSSTTPLLEGFELQYPHFWIKDASYKNENFELNLDSAGIYYASSGEDKEHIMRFKMELLWQHKDSANVVILGSSRPKNAVIPLSLDTVFYGVNLANSFFSINETYFLLKNYLLPHYKKLKYLVISLDIDMWHRRYNSYANFFYRSFRKFPGYVYDENHDFWKEKYPEGLAEATSECIGSTYYKNKLIPTRGYHQFESGGWPENPPFGKDSAWTQDSLSSYTGSFEYLKKALDLAEENNLKVVGVIFPQSPSYKNTGAFGFYGVRRSEAPHFIEEISALQKSYKNFIFMDENKMGDHDYTDDMARDRDHLAHEGALQITKRINQALRSFEN